MSQVLTAASREWASRPDDQRYLSMAELKAAVSQRRSESWTATPSIADLRIVSNGNEPGDISVDIYDPSAGQRRLIEPTHFGFGQLAQYASCPAAYLRRLPAELAAINLQWGLEHDRMRDDGLILAQSNGEHHLRAITSTSYGRIWDSQVVDAVERVNTDGRWKIPAASYATQNPKRATTLYASDRDVFIFLVDDSHPIEIPGEDQPMYRGFYTWNSEVGACTFGIATFLYRYVCDNRMIWGATNVRELKIRHTGGAPERFSYEGAKYLNQYGNEGTAEIVGQIVRAKSLEIDAEPIENSKDKGVAAWLQKRGFSKSEATGAVNSARAEEGKARTLWDIVNGITSYARTIPHTDARVDIETKAGRLMGMVAE